MIFLRNCMVDFNEAAPRKIMPSVVGETSRTSRGSFGFIHSLTSPPLVRENHLPVDDELRR